MLRRQLERAVETGIAYEWEESTPGLLCVAAPVLDPGGRTAVAAISVSGPAGRFRPESHENTVRSAAAALGAVMAGRPRG